MGALADWQPPDKEAVFFGNIIRIMDEYYPSDWRNWIVNVTTYEDLFGEKISSDLECRLRFAIPTVALALAYSTNPTLSERRYRSIKRILISWPLGRALIYAPLSITAKIHPAEAYSRFDNTVYELKKHLISRQEATKNLNLSSAENDETEDRASSSNSTLKRSHSPDPPVNAKEPKMSDYIAQQNKMFEKLCDMIQCTNQNIMLMNSKQDPSNNSSQGMDSESLSEQDAQDEQEWVAPAVADEPQSDEEFEDFTPGTKESEAKITKANDVLAKQGIHCQRFNSDGWQNIRYAEVQKLFQASPAFTSLKVNSNLATVTPNWHMVTLLEKMDSCLGAITHGLLQERQLFQEAYLKAPSEVKSYISSNLIKADTPYRKTSDALLQYTCGKRAETIQQRRSIYKPTNKTLNELLHGIPPSDTHLFSEPNLSDFVKEQGGIVKLFPGKFRKQATAVSTGQFNRSATAFKTTKKPAAAPETRDRQNNYYRNSSNRKQDRSRYTNKRAPAKQNYTRNKK